MFLRSLSTLSRRTVVILGVAAMLSVATGVTAPLAQGQATPPQQPPAGQPPAGQPPAGQQPAAPQPAGPMLPMTSDAGLILFTVKADAAEAGATACSCSKDFEAFMAKVKEALEKSPKPEYKQMASGWKLYKGLEGAEAGQLLYVAVIDPAVKGVDYDPLKIVREVLPTEEAAMRPKILAAVAGVNKLNLQNTLKMGGN